MSPEVSVPIDSEALKELVRKVFGLSKKRQLFYSRLFDRKSNPKTPEKVSQSKIIINYCIQLLFMLISSCHFYTGCIQWLRTVQIHTNVSSIPKLALPLLKCIFCCCCCCCCCFAAFG